MYKLNDKKFTSASDALDQYIKNYQLNNFKNMETSVAKSTTKEYRLDKLEVLMNSKIKSPIFNNFISSANSSESEKHSMKNDTNCNAINQVEKLINNLTNKVEDYKSDSKKKLLTL